MSSSRIPSLTKYSSSSSGSSSSEKGKNKARVSDATDPDAPRPVSAGQHSRDTRPVQDEESAAVVAPEDVLSEEEQEEDMAMQERLFRRLVSFNQVG